jgi:hypothetical protein
MDVRVLVKGKAVVPVDAQLRYCRQDGYHSTPHRKSRVNRNGCIVEDGLDVSHARGSSKVGDDKVALRKRAEEKRMALDGEHMESLSELRNGYLSCGCLCMVKCLITQSLVLRVNALVFSVLFDNVSIKHIGVGDNQVQMHAHPSTDEFEVERGRSMKWKRDEANSSSDGQIWNDNLDEEGQARPARKLGSINQVVSKCAGLSCVLCNVTSASQKRRGI